MAGCPEGLPTPRSLATTTAFISPSEHRLVESSPPSMIFTPKAEGNNAEGYFGSAPAVMGPAPRKLSGQKPELKHSFDAGGKGPRVAAAKGWNVAGGPSDPTLSQQDGAVSSLQSLPEEITSEILPGGELAPKALTGTSDDDVDKAGSPGKALVDEGESLRRQGKAAEVDDDRGDALGNPFEVEWLCTDRLPFHRTRHLRNPWNHDREIKVSRDGTELEPNVGQKLLDDWRTLVE